MANNDGKITLGLDTQKTAAQINADINKLQGQLKKVKATGALDTNPTVKQINAQISALQSQLKTIKINAKIGESNAAKAARETGNNIAQNIADGISQAGGTVDSEVQKLADRTIADTIGSFGTIGLSIAGIFGKGRSNTILPCRVATPYSKP